MAFHWSVRVYYEDTDAGGVVYHANYLRFMERARTEWLRERGVEQDWLRETHGIVFVVTRSDVHFMRPARFNDRLVITVGPERMGRTRIRFSQHVNRSQRDGELLCDGRVEAACVDIARFRARPIPDFLNDRLKL